ncbi:kinesin-related protein [Forsythia ovata]|uniref:Kinesin-related protein n=1 Tax=Forsythia ovata TaxID=205694 RepID=A0ABD1RLG0_9LAMI
MEKNYETHINEYKSSSEDLRLGCSAVGSDYTKKIHDFLQTHLRTTPRKLKNGADSSLVNFDDIFPEIKRKVNSSRVLYSSHFEVVQNVVRLHKASSNDALEEVSALASSNSCSIEEFIDAGAVEANSVFDDLQDALSSHQGETAHLARELRQLINTSETIHEFLDKLLEESKSLERHATEVDEIQLKSIVEFQKAYEEQSRSDAEKLIADMTTLVSGCMRRLKEMVDARLGDIKESVIGNKIFIDGHVSSMEGIAMDLKRKWQDSFKLAENNFKDSADFSAAKHCRMDANTAETALKQWQRTQESLNDMGSQHAATIASHFRSICDTNEQHDTEINSARVMAEEDITKNSENIVQCLGAIPVWTLVISQEP